VADKAYLSYSQSYSITKFLVETYGQEKMTSLLLSLRDGLTIDEALMQTYSFDVEGLEGAWREAIGAPPHAVSAQPTLQSTPTFVPTIVPVGGQASSVLQVTSTPVPTSSFGREPTQTPARTGPPLALTMILLGICCSMLVLVGVVVLGFVIRNQHRKGENHAE
jgi:hypothetical protein